MALCLILRTRLCPNRRAVGVLAFVDGRKERERRETPMKVVMVGPFGLRPRGTMSRRALPLAKELAARGHEVEVVLPPWDCPEESGRCWQEVGVSVTNFALPPSVPLWGEVLIAVRISRRVLRAKPDVVHFFKPKGYAGAAAYLLWYLRRLGSVGARLVLDTDDLEGPGGWNEMGLYSAWQKWLFAWQEKWGLRHCDALTAGSGELARLALTLGVAEDRVFHVPNGSDCPKGALRAGEAARVGFYWDLPEGPVVLLYTRFFEFRSERVIRVLGRVFDEEPSARLLLVGKGLFGEEKRFLSLAEQAGLGSRVAYAGWREFSELPAYFAAADVAVCPLEDNLLNRARCPAKIVDLMAAGVPVVAESVGEVGQYVEHLGTGYLVPPGDEDALVAGVLRLLRDEPLRSTLGRRAARHISDHFSWSGLAETVEGAYLG
jgi:glycosyltransferase involved in cell wall biosynthesis